MSKAGLPLHLKLNPNCTIPGRHLGAVQAMVKALAKHGLVVGELDVWCAWTLYCQAENHEAWFDPLPAISDTRLSQILLSYLSEKE